MKDNINQIVMLLVVSAVVGLCGFFYSTNNQLITVTNNNAHTTKQLEYLEKRVYNIEAVYLRNKP
jgi:hypothetical protein